MPTNDALDPAQLPAGPELDVQVQRVVFGTKIKSIRCPNDNPDWPMYIPSGKPWRTHAIDAIPVPKYSTSIEAAWLIVEAFPSCCFRIDRERAAGIRYDATIIMDGEQPYDHGRTIHAMAATAPLAICRAALSAATMAPEGLNAR
jgi:hypothetical protein